MTEELQAPGAAVLSASGRTIRASTPPRRASGRTLLTDASDQREAQELSEMEPFQNSDADRINEHTEDAQATHASRESRNRLTRSGTNASSQIQGNGWWPRFRRVWRNHVSLRVPAESRRDHLALERTYLGYVRTSLALSITGITIAQLFRLAGSINPGEKALPVGLPLAASFIISSILVVLLGAVRFWRQQTAMARGKIWAGGFEILLIMGICVVLCIAAFVVVVNSVVTEEL